MDVQVVGPSVRLEAIRARVLAEFVPPYEDQVAGIPPAAEQADGPGVTLADWGKGRAVCCAVDLGAALFTEGTPMLRRLILWLLGMVHPESERHLIVTGVPVGVEVFHSRSPGQHLVHLVNYGCDKRETGTPQTQGFPSLQGIGISLALERPPAEVRAVPGGEAINAEYRDGRVRFSVTLSGLHAVYRIQT
jgi:hypothetical protein